MLRDVCDRDKEIPAKKVAECLQTSKKADVGELARRMGQGDREAAAQFMHEYGDLIRRRIHGKMHAGVRRVFDTQDIISTFGRHLDSYVLDKKFEVRSEDEFWAWIFQVANRLMVDKVRLAEKMRRKEGQDSEFAGWMLERLRDQEASDEPEPPAGLRGLSLEEMLAPLHSEDDRTIATLWALDVPYTQIAAETGLSYDVVRQRWHRIQEALRSAHSETKT